MAIVDTNGTTRVLALGAPAGPPGLSAYQHWLSLGNTGSIADYLASLKGTDGTNGTKGIDGAGTIVTLIASSRILPSSAVVPDGQFGAAPANPANPAHANLVVGVTAVGAEAGGLVTIQGSGDLDGLVGNFAAGDILFPSTNGTLTRVVPTSGWRQALGKASSSSRMIVNIGPAYTLPNPASLLIAPGDDAIATILLAALTPSVLQAAHARWVASLSPLPADDSAIPNAGGWYLNDGQPYLVPPKA